MKLLIAFLLLAVITVLTKSVFFSFRAQSPADYASTSPAFCNMRRCAVAVWAVMPAAEASSLLVKDRPSISSHSIRVRLASLRAWPMISKRGVVISQG